MTIRLGRRRPRVGTGPTARAVAAAVTASATVLGLALAAVPAAAATLPVVEDFEAPGLPALTGPTEPGFSTFSGAGSSAAVAVVDGPERPGGGTSPALRLDVESTSYAGVIQRFGEPGGAWAPQDWSPYAALELWFHGSGSGAPLFLDLLENRKPGSSSDDAQRWVVTFTDDAAGWQRLELPFTDFTEKQVGNGAPSDELTLTEVHGWALGALSSGGPQTFYVDDLAVVGTAEVPDLAVGFAAKSYDAPEGTTRYAAVRLNRAMTAGDPAEVRVDYAVEPGTATPGADFRPATGTLTFTPGGPRELTIPFETLDDDDYEGDERAILRLSDPVGAAPGFTMQAAGRIVDDETYDPDLLEDAERDPHLWRADGTSLERREIPAGSPQAVPGQDAREGVLAATGARRVEVQVKGRICDRGNGVVPVAILTTPTFDAATVDHLSVRVGQARETHGDPYSGGLRRHLEDVDRDGDRDLVVHVRGRETGLGCDPAVVPVTGLTRDGVAITNGDAGGVVARAFPIGQDWTHAESLDLWFHGTGSGEPVTLRVLDNRAPDPGPAGWELVWSDDFDGAAGSPPDPARWGHELGDGTVNGIPGWGNSELQYYTDSTDNAALDGAGNLVIRAAEADGEQCYYGTCEYTSARLVSKHRYEVAHGRVEARVRVPDGAAGLWPAFWALGTDIDRVGWPASGEIDVMEYVSRAPREVFGTVHGPGYAGGASISGEHAFGQPVSDGFHTFAVQWEPGRITWLVDGEEYHTVAAEDVAPNPWVGDHPYYLLLNLAVGGNLGGPLADGLDFPQEMTVDHVRVYQGPDTAERFEATFTDDVAGWQRVSVPFTDLTRSAEQPAGAPDDGLGLADVRGLELHLPATTSAPTFLLDDLRVVPVPAPTEVVVETTAGSGPGSLRAALAAVADGGTVAFDPALAGATIALDGALVVDRSVTVDAADAPGLTLDAGGADRVLVVEAGADVVVRGLVLTGGRAAQVGGGVLNNGTLTLDRSVVTGNRVTGAGEFWMGGGGIYSGEGATLTLVETTVSDNVSEWTGGGIYTFFGTTTTLLRSTVSGNLAMDVAGGLRTLGDVAVTSSTISGNTSTTWHGGGMFVTDGAVDIESSTVTGNAAPGGTAGGLFVGTFTDSGASLTLRGSVVAGNGDLGCFLAPFGAGAVALTSLGGNVLTDASCDAGAEDQVVADAGLDALADNGGPTATHALRPGSPALDAADPATSPATDQRGVPRPQRAGPDAGAFELE